MSSGPPDFDEPGELVPERRSLRDVMERSFLEGLAILLPLLVTLFIISFALTFLFRQIQPIVTYITESTGFRNELLVAGLTVVVFVLTVFAVGFISKFGTNRARISNQFHRFMESIPAVGRVYTSFNQMASLMLDSDTDSFQEVKLVEYPREDSYVVAFKTAETPEVIARDTNTDDMVTLFMPMAPNPVMGGFVIHVSRDRVVDVDLTVEEGVRSIVTSGVAMTTEDGSVDGLTEAQMRQLGNTEQLDAFAPVGNGPESSEEDAGGTTAGSDRTDGHGE